MKRASQPGKRRSQPGKRTSEPAKQKPTATARGPHPARSDDDVEVEDVEVEDVEVEDVEVGGGEERTRRLSCFP